MGTSTGLRLAVVGVAQFAVYAGIDTWTSRGPDGGSVQAVAIDAANPAIIYTGTSGGVFRSTDGATSWSAANSGLGPGPVFAVAVAPQEPETVYALNVSGMFKSTNSGTTWNPVQVPPVAGGGPATAIAVDPQNRGTIYISNCAGIFKSADGGATWSNVWSHPSYFACPAFLAIDPQNPNNVYAGLDGLMRSADAGVTWSIPLRERLLGLSQSNVANCDVWGYYYAQTTGHPAPAPEAIGCEINGSRDAQIYVDQYLGDLRNYASQQGDAAMFGLMVGPVRLAIDPQNSAVLYASSYLGVFKSADGGQGWALVNSGLPGVQPGILALDPKNPATLYVGTFSGLYRSTDGARSWNAAGSLPVNGSPGPLVPDPQNSGTLYLGTSLGLFKSVDAGGTWAPANSGLAASYVWSVAADTRNRGTVFANVQGTGAPGGPLLKTTDGGTTWTSTGLTALGLVDFVVAQDSATVYAFVCCTPAGTMGQVPTLFKSTDGGVNWVKTGGYPQNWIIKLAVDTRDPSVVYASNSNGVFKSSDSGATWTGLGPEDSTGSSYHYYPVLAVDPQNPQTLYTARPNSDDGGGAIFKTTDGGQTWNKLPLGWDNDLYDVTVVAADPRTPGIVYAGTQARDCEDYNCPADYNTRLAAGPGTGLFKSKDGGQSWMKLKTPAGDLYRFATDPANAGTLYGLFGYSPSNLARSTDGGATWTPIGAGLTASVSALAVDGQTPSTVYAATYGGGVFEMTFATQ
jgi:photosystem II stability/assembly factor-like uncharacterized protein